MTMQKATAQKIANFKTLIGTNVYTYNDLTELLKKHKGMPSWDTLRKYNVINIVRTESYTTELDDNGQLWNGWYEWNAATGKWIIDHNFNLYGLV